MMLETKTSLWHVSLLEFRTRVAAGSATPGGGAVAAVTATLAAALMRMTAAITLRHTKDAKLQAFMAAVEVCEEKLAQYADEDVRAFDRYVAARKNNNADPSSEVQECLLVCAKVPLEAAEQVANLQALATEIAASIPAFLASDLATAMHLLHAARQALLANVEINCSDLENNQEKRALLQRLEPLLASRSSSGAL